MKGGCFHPASLRTSFFPCHEKEVGKWQMIRKTFPKQAPPAEAPTPTVENAAALEQPAPEPALTDAEAVMLEHEGQEALFEMGEVVPDSADAAIHAELEEASTPSDATRAEKEEIVYLNLSDLHPFKNHPFGVRDDAEMQGLVESVKAAGVNQPAPVRPREDGGYEVIVGNRRKQASELAGLAENGGREKADVHPSGGDIIHPPQKSEVKNQK